MPIIVERGSSPVEFDTVPVARLTHTKHIRLTPAQKSALVAANTPRSDPAWRPKKTIQRFPQAAWIHLNDGDLDALIAAEANTKYWKIVGDAVLEMTGPEKTAVDDAELQYQAAQDNKFELMFSTAGPHTILDNVHGVVSIDMTNVAPATIVVVNLPVSRISPLTIKRWDTQTSVIVRLTGAQGWKIDKSTTFDLGVFPDAVRLERGVQRWVKR